MNFFKIFHVGHELSVTSEQKIDKITKIASQNDHVFLLTGINHLYYGSLSGDSSASIHFDLIRSDINDIDCSDDSIYVTDKNGCVQHCPLMAFAFDKHWNDIPIVNYNAIYEGVTTNSGDLVRISNVNCSNDGVLFTTYDRELYGMGNFGDVCTSDQPIKIVQFINHEILQVEAGKHFVVVLTRRRNKRKSISTLHNNVNRNDDTMSITSNFSLNVSHQSSQDNTLNMSDISLLETSFVSKVDEPLKSNDSIINIINDSVSLKTITNNGDVESSSSEYNSLAIDIEHEIGKLVKTGNDLIRTYVWCFGTVNKGHLGTGDHIKRKKAVEIIALAEQGVRELSCGEEHSAALTLDGRLYLWGDNSHEQISHWLEKEDCSSPKRYYTNEQNVLETKCGQYSTFILANNLERTELSRNKYFASIPLDKHSENKTDFLFLANKHFLVVGTAIRKLKFEKYLKFEQEFLQDILQKMAPFYSKILRAMNNIAVFKHSIIYREFFRQYNNIMDLSAVNVRTIMEYARGYSDFDRISFIKNYQEYIHVYRSYTKYYCDILCSDDFQKTWHTIIPNLDFVSKSCTPLHHISNYIEFIRDLITLEANEHEILTTAQTHWEQFRNDMDTMLKLADLTVSFWNVNQKNLPSFLQVPSRRIIIDSKEQPLKLLPSSRFTSNWFILFNDVFCHSTGNSNSIKQYPLKTLWISSVPEKDTSSGSSSSTLAVTRKHALKITTPEEQFTVSAKSNEIKMKWFQLIEQYVKLALEKPDNRSILSCRITTHTFSEKHKIYPNCKYIGRWYYGKMHGIGYLKYADGRIFTGQFHMGIVNGYGRLIIPNVSCYEGQFLNGKYDGCGILELQNLNGTYDGAFKNGLQHGHGTLIDDQKTYIGEFCNGVQHGYGVLDDSNTGEKYMGMFIDDKRNGQGFCITVDAKYFEGNFIDNELNGNGVAIFNNGNYYEGDLNEHGPSGRGTLFLPIEAAHDENCFDLDERKSLMSGNKLIGNLGGVWDDIKINNGTISLNQEFPKYSSLFGSIQIENKRKWLSLFIDWENDIFGVPINEINDIKKIWLKIIEYIQTSKQNDSLKSTISESAILFESGEATSNQNQHHHSYTDQFLHIIHARNSHDQKESKSMSLSRITAKNYKRNLVTIERTKSISNDFLNTANRFNDNDDPFECNNNENNGDKLLSASAIKNSTPCFGISKLDKEDMILVRDYLTKSFKNPNHPLGVLNAKISFCFYTSYGCWKVKPIAILSTQAMKEWECISKRIYDIVRRLFPTLPLEYGNLDDEFISHRSLLYPILLSEGVYSTLFVLYANKCSKRDELYRQRVLFCEKKNDAELLEFLKISSDYLSMVQHDEFILAINELRQVKEKFCPREMLKLIEQTFKYVERSAEIISLDRVQKQNLAVQTEAFRSTILSSSTSSESVAAIASLTSIAPSPSVLLNADNMMPLTIYLLLRASIPHLGTEILLLEDLMGTDFEFVMHGYAGYCFTTVKAAYQHIINESFLQQ